MIKKILKDFDFLQRFRTENIVSAFDRLGGKIGGLLESISKSVIALNGLTNKHSVEIKHLRKSIDSLVYATHDLNRTVRDFDERFFKEKLIEASDVMEPFNQRFREAKVYYEDQILELQQKISDLKIKSQEKETKNETVHRTTKRNTRNLQER